MDKHAVPLPNSSGAGEQEVFGIVCSQTVGSAALSSSPLLYVFTLEPLLRRLRDGGTSPSLHRIQLHIGLTASMSTFADDVTMCVSSRDDIVAAKEALARYKIISEAKINLEKNEISQKWRQRLWPRCKRRLLRRNGQRRVPRTFFSWSFTSCLYCPCLELNNRLGSTSLLWKRGQRMICRHVCFQRSCNGDLGMPNFTSHWLAEKLIFLGWSLTEDSA